MSKQANLSVNEKIKEASQLLRGTIAQGLNNPITGALSEDDQQLTKFHGFYQQDDRDVRVERKQQKLEPLYSFMLRGRVPGGVATPAQWIAIDDIANELTEAGSIRLTTRQTFQFHGILKPNLKPVIQELAASKLDAIAACGDVNRNVLCNSNPKQSKIHQQVYQWAVKISEHLMPNTKAYYELFLDGKKLDGTPLTTNIIQGESNEGEPIYGATYLPRKFKVTIAVPPVNDVDIHANDLNFIALVENEKLIGFNVIVGGGMGSTHGDKTTYPCIGSDLGFINVDDCLAVSQAVLTTQRDHGNRSDRKHARLKYTLERLGVDFFREEVEQRSQVQFAPSKPFTFTSQGDRLGWVKGIDGTLSLTCFIESGRIKDKPNKPLKTGLRKIAEYLESINTIHNGQTDIRMTANQNIMIANIPAHHKDYVEQLAGRCGLIDERYSPIALNAIACVALPTCALAMAEAERYLFKLIEKLDQLAIKHNISDQAIVTRMTGCPNGCGRPFLAEIGFVGKGPGRYNLYLGADGAGMRLNKLYRENIDETEILSVLETLFESYSKNRQKDLVTGKHERFGNFVVRTGVVKAVTKSSAFHD